MKMNKQEMIIVGVQEYQKGGQRPITRAYAKRGNTMEPILKFAGETEPKTFNEALKRSDADKGKQAGNEELGAFRQNNTLELSDINNDEKILSSKWGFKLKADADGTLERYKASLVAC